MGKHSNSDEKKAKKSIGKKHKIDKHPSSNEERDKKSKREKKEKQEKKEKKEKKENKEKKEKHEKKEKKEKKERKEKKEKKVTRDSKVKTDNTEKATSSAPKTSNGGRFIGEEDYFVMSEEFRVWCKLVRNRPFENLTSDEARELFNEIFVIDYNDGKLPLMFYDGIPYDIRESVTKTNHKWGFKVTADEQEKLALVSDEVDNRTRTNFQGAWRHMNSSFEAQAATGGSVSSARALREDDERDKQKRNRDEDRKRQRAHLNDIVEEVAPHEPSKQALLDKKKGFAQSSHESYNRREEDRDGLNLDESFTMGGGDDFASMKQQMNRRKDLFQEKRTERLSELQRRDEERNSSFWDRVGSRT